MGFIPFQNISLTFFALHLLKSKNYIFTSFFFAAVNLSFSFRTPSITRRNPLSCVSIMLGFFFVKFHRKDRRSLKEKEVNVSIEKGKPHVIEEFFCGSDRQSLPM